MNASYKIVLLAAFVIFALVVGFYILSETGGASPSEATEADAVAAADQGQTPPDNEARVEQTPSRTPPTRPGLDRSVPVETDVDIPQVTIDTPAEQSPQIDDVPSRTGPGSAGSASQAAADNSTGRPGPGVARTDDIDSAMPPDAQPGITDAGAATQEPDEEDLAAVDNEAEPAEPERTTEQPRPRQPTPTGNRRTYTVKPGDTFASIAIEAYGEEQYWFEIAQANPSVDPKRLQVDQVIVLPDLSDNNRRADEPTPPAPGQDQTYTVKPGDVLSRIAERFYGDSEAWDLIYNRNRDKIGADPNRLQAGMVLIIPQAYNGAE